MCNDPNLRKEFPITKDGIFSDDANDDPGKFRAIYAYDPNSGKDFQGNPTATYCGTIYHTGKGNLFTGCDVKR